MKTELIDRFKNHLLSLMIVFPFAFNGIPFFVGSFVLSLIIVLYQRESLKLIFDMRVFVLIIFLVWTVLSSFIFFIEFGRYEIRDVIKVIFPFFYFMLVVRFPLNVYEFEKVFVFYVKLLSITICLSFVYLYITSFDILMDGIQSKLWGSNLLPGWPNGLIIPLFFGFYLALKLKISNIWLLCIFASNFLILSRAALVSSLLLYLFYRLSSKRNSLAKIYMIIIFSFTLIAAIFLYEFSLNSYFYMSDRMDIYLYALSYISERPLLGFGGKTLDQLEWFDVGYSPLMSWSHAHNFIFEFMLRYGLVGACLFCLILILSFVKISNYTSKVVFVMLIALALFQTHFQEVQYLFIMGFLINHNLIRHFKNPNFSIVNCRKMAND